MCTGALVCIPSYQIIAEQAAARIGNTHCSVNEGLNLHVIRNIGTDLADFLQGKLTGGYHTLRSKLVSETVSLVIDIVGLGTDMALNLRTDLLGIGENTWICYDQGVRF